MSPEPKLLELIERVEAVSPRLVDHWQTMAIVESLGYTDRIIKEEFGFADVLEIGQYIYQRHNSPATESDDQISDEKEGIFNELYVFVQQFSRSFVYAIPLISLLVFGNLQTAANYKFIPPQLAALFTLATLASLITSGGFVQAIARRGEFYLGLDLPQQVRKTCTSLLGWGMLSSFILGMASLWFGFYRGMFADEYLVLGTAYYLVLSLLWMLLAILALEHVWSTAIALIGLTILFLTFRNLGLGDLEAQVGAIFITLLCLLIIAFVLLLRHKIKYPAESKIKLPQASATIYLLAPFFGYGIVYFSFIFADRLVAGLAVDQASGLFFAIDSAYQRAMDLALLNFLLTVPLSEYLAYKIINFWYKQAKITPFADAASLSKKLNRGYLILIVIVFCFFSLLMAITVGLPTPKPWATANPGLTLIGCMGYLLLVLGLLNAVILFNLNTASAAISALFPSLLVNLAVGYIAANVIAPEWAVLGLVIGSIVFILLSRRKVLRAIDSPDYAYYLGGY